MNPEPLSAVSTASADSLEKWGSQCLQALGLPTPHAAFVARSLVQTSLWGIDSHGIARLPHYLSRLAAGSLNPNPQMVFTSTGSCTGNLDGDHGLGLVVCERATQEAITMAQANGAGFIGVRNSSHCGAIGIFGRIVADAGLIGLVFTHSDAFVAPHNGYEKFLGTNPICISAPCADGPPVCLDMATSAAAWNKIMNARREGVPIDDSLAYDTEGRPTVDPDAVACLRPMAGHKGYALAFMIELLCGPLNGAPWGPNIPPMYGDLSQRRLLGSFVGAIDPKRFAGGAAFPAVVRDMAASARTQARLNPEEPVLVPGDDHYANENKRRLSGIPIEPGLAAQFAEWSQKLRVHGPAFESPNS
ncbi:MAG: Ldh family oxidoreductase [Opitutaceae bacterium]